MSASPSAVAQTMQPPLQSVVIVANPQTSNSTAQAQFNSVQIAGIVLASVALALTIVVTLACLLWIRKRRNSLRIEDLKEICPALKYSGSISSLSNPLVSEERNAPPPGHVKATAGTDQPRDRPRNWPKYYRISPPLQKNGMQRVSSQAPTKAKSKTRSSNSTGKRDRAAKPQLHVVTTGAAPVQSGHQHSSQVSQNVAQPMHHAVDLKGKGRAPTGPTHPLNMLPVQNPYRPDLSIRIPDHTHNARSENLYAYDPSAPQQAGRLSTQPSTHLQQRISHPSVSVPTVMAPKTSRSSKGDDRQRAAYAPGSQASGSNPRAESKTKKEPSSRKQSLSSTKNHPRKKRSRKHLNHSIESSATDFETSDCDCRTEDELEATLSRASQFRASAAPANDRSPISDLKYPKVPVGSNARNQTSVIIPRTSIPSNPPGQGGIHVQNTPSRGNSPFSAQLGTMRTSTRTISRSSTPSTVKTTASPKTPTMPWSLEKKDPRMQILHSTSNTPVSAAGSPQIVRASADIDPKLAAVRPPPFALRAAGSRVTRQHLPHSDVYDFF